MKLTPNQLDPETLKQCGIVLVAPRLQEYVPYEGDFSHGGVALGPHGGIDARLAKSWASMLKRCYDPLAPDFHKYGAAGISVCKEWHSLAEYIRAIKMLPNWGKKLADWEVYQLDKDYYSSNQYSPSTCVWLTVTDNSTYRSTTVPISITDCFGRAKVYLSIREASRALGFCRVTLQNLRDKGPISGNYKLQSQLIGWRIDTYTPEHPIRRGL